jgi:hypothetical protein
LLPWCFFGSVLVMVCVVYMRLFVVRRVCASSCISRLFGKFTVSDYSQILSSHSCMVLSTCLHTFSVYFYVVYVRMTRFSCRTGRFCVQCNSLRLHFSPHQAQVGTEFFSFSRYLLSSTFSLKCKFV